MMLCLLLASCKKPDDLIVDNARLYGEWKWISNTNYLVSDNKLTLYSVLPGLSYSHISFWQNGTGELSFYGVPDTVSYSYTPDNAMLIINYKRTYVNTPPRLIDTVKVLTDSLLVLHYKEVDTASLSPLTTREILRIDTLRK